MRGWIYFQFGLNVFVLAMVGCQSNQPSATTTTTWTTSNQSNATPTRSTVAKPEGTISISSTDACAGRLHDACGPFVLYVALNQSLPSSLADLRNEKGEKLPDSLFICPDSKKPYIYNPQGLRVVGHNGVIVLYDAEPTHLGMRRAVLMGVDRVGQPPSARVIAVPEAEFNVKLPSTADVGQNSNR